MIDVPDEEDIDMPSPKARASTVPKVVQPGSPKASYKRVGGADDVDESQSLEVVEERRDAKSMKFETRGERVVVEEIERQSVGIGERKRSVRLSTEVEVQEYVKSGASVSESNAAHDEFLRQVMAHGNERKEMQHGPKIGQLQGKTLSTDMAKADFAERLAQHERNPKIAYTFPYMKDENGELIVYHNVNESVYHERRKTRIGIREDHHEDEDDDDNEDDLGGDEQTAANTAVNAAQSVRPTQSRKTNRRGTEDFFKHYAEHFGVDHAHEEHPETGRMTLKIDDHSHVDMESMADMRSETAARLAEVNNMS